MRVDLPGKGNRIVIDERRAGTGGSSVEDKGRERQGGIPVSR